MKLHWSDGLWVIGYLAIIVASAFWSCGCGQRFVFAPTEPGSYEVAPIPPPPLDAGAPPQERLCCSSSEAGMVLACGFMSWICSDGGEGIGSLAYCGAGSCERWQTCYLPSYGGEQGIVLPCR